MTKKITENNLDSAGYTLKICQQLRQLIKSPGFIIEVWYAGKEDKILFDGSEPEYPLFKKAFEKTLERCLKNLNDELS